MLRAATVLALGMLVPRLARADGPITNRDYSLDLYDGVAIGNTTIVGMGGTGAAFVVGSAGALINASAPAVRATTDTDSWNWDFHFDYVTSQFSTDYDNNGRVAPGSDGFGGANLLSLGASIRVQDWAIAGTVTGQVLPLVGAPQPLYVEALRLKFVLAKFIPQLDLAVGLGVQSAEFDLSLSGAMTALFDISGIGGVAGATWLPHLRNVRIGAGFETAIDGGTVQPSSCDPNNCDGYILPSGVVSPWRAVGGVAYRWSETEWNQLVGGDFRDEPSLTVAADVVVTGASDNAYGVEPFGTKQLQRSGRDIAVSIRGGAEYECLPGRLRVRGGSYWEPGRYDDVGGRIHGTFGADLRAFEFELWGRRRGRISATADLAARFANIGVSVGFWH